jgi:hypothetical protein
MSFANMVIGVLSFFLNFFSDSSIAQR